MRCKWNTSRIRRSLSYSVQEICQLFGIHKNTVREWFRHGLPRTDDKRPFLVHGNDLRTFLNVRRKARRRTCAPDEFYCFRCRLARRAMGNLVDIGFCTKKTFILNGYCEHCDTPVRKLQSFKTLSQTLSIFDIPTPQREQLLGCISPSVNCDLESETAG